GKEHSEIFEAHLLVLKDPDFFKSVVEKIQNERLSAANAVHLTAEAFIELFNQMDNEYMKERSADIHDVSQRVKANLLGVHLASAAEIDEEVILVADDLLPSDTAQLNREHVRGIVTNIGGRTSHSAIMSRSMEIPAVVGTKTAVNDIEHGMLTIVDGIEGQVIVAPDSEELAFYEKKKQQVDSEKEELRTLVDQATVTLDGRKIELAANIGTPEDMQAALDNGAEGIGLFRTEFLYMDRDGLPSEEEQFKDYRKVLEAMNGKPVVIRTLDIGGDKHLPYLNLPKELNPFLGYRAIRMCLQEEDIFRTQLRALLRASVHGNLKIMFPMIATIDEFRAAREMLMEEKDKLLRNGIVVSDEIEVGMMMEVPAAAMAADVFAPETDFFSIGTNDLTQYSMAADRMNERVSYLYQPHHPGIIKMIQNIIEAAHKEKKWVGMCGEMASDSELVPVLLGLGLDEFSVNASSILPVRKQILNSSY
ncbi:MAG TPA: phosphoenolpyruvate--protein phosphotransferase, partial [Bacillales bacterium]|nr:phosphoenolpyruvate--protein phosphotransferase [Bacillales bacterium]